MEKNWILEQPAVFSASERTAEQTPPPIVEEPSFPPPKSVPIAAEKPKALPKCRLTTVLAVLFLAGVAYGAVLAAGLEGELAGTLRLIAERFLAERAEADLQKVFLHTFVSCLLVGGGMFFCGFSAIGQPASMLLLLFRAIGLGMSMGNFYMTLEGRELLAALVLLLPAGALSGYALLLACRESMRMSGKFFRAMTGEEVFAEPAAGVYGVKFLIIALMLLAAAMADAGCAKFFQMLH